MRREELLLLLLHGLVMLLFALVLEVALNLAQVQDALAAVLIVHAIHLVRHVSLRLRLLLRELLLLVELRLGLLVVKLLLRHDGLLLLLHVILTVVFALVALLTDSLVDLSWIILLLSLLILVRNDCVQLAVSARNTVQLLAVPLEDDERVGQVELRLLHVQVEEHILMVAHLIHFDHLLS